MRDLFRSFAPLLLALCVLLGSIGMAFGETLCQLTGSKALTTIYAADACCKNTATDDATGEEDDDCCTKEITFEKLEPVSSQKAFQVEFPVFFTWVFPAHALHAVALTHQKQQLLASANNSPPRGGRQLLLYLHTLII